MIDPCLRMAGPDDLPNLLALYRHLIPEEAPAPLPVAEEKLAALTAIPGSGIWVVETDTGLVASVTLIVVPNMTRHGAPYAFIENVVCRRDYRRQGHVSALLAKVEEVAWAQGCYRIMIVSGNHNTGAHATYVSAGYVASKTGFQKRRIADRVPQG